MNSITLIVNSLLKILLKMFFGIVFMIYRENDKNVQKIIDLYKGNGFKSLFAKIRYWDSPFVQLEKSVPKSGSICDLGCGDGLFTNYLAITGPKRKIFGVDVNDERVKDADKGLSNAKFLTGDVLKAKLKFPDVILLVHLLHHLNSYKEQEDIIKNCYQKLSKNGKLIIAEIDKTPKLKYLLTLLTDSLIFPILFEKKLMDKVYYRDQKEWKYLLESLGFKVKVEKVYNKPFTHIIIIGEK